VESALLNVKSKKWNGSFRHDSPSRLNEDQTFRKNKIDDAYVMSWASSLMKSDKQFASSYLILAIDKMTTRHSNLI